jgi:arginyl-tRNA synthetase
VPERGESSYSALLPRVLRDLRAAGLLRESDGAQLVYLPDADSPARQQVVLRKRDGGYVYATTDLAALRHRLRGGYDRVLYVVDSSQSHHFQCVFDVARRAGWLDDGKVHVRHLPFGLVKREDGKKLSSRDGTQSTLSALLDEGAQLALSQVDEASVPPAMRRGTAEAIACSAVRYFDLSHHRARDYSLSFSRMLSFKGNTAVYLHYALVRLAAMQRKAAEASAPGWGEPLLANELADLSGGDTTTPAASNLLLPPERALLMELAAYPDALVAAASDGAPNVLCDHAYSLAQALHKFYEECRVLGDPRERLRLQLCHAAQQVLGHEMQLLGAQRVDRM